MTRLGAAVSVRTKGNKLDKNLKNIDVLIADDAPPSDLVHDASTRDIFPVSTEWIVQCLISGRKVPQANFVI